MNFLGTKSLLTIVAALVFFTLTIFFIAALFAAVKPTFVKDDTPFLWFGLWKVVAFSLKQALCSTGISLILGIAVAFYTSNRNFPGSSFLLSFSAIPLCVPPLLVALGFVMFFGMGGWLNKTLMSIFSLSEPPLSFLYSFWGIILAQGFYNFPIVMKTCHESWLKIPAEEKQAAELLGANKFKVFRTITFFHLLPGIISSGMTVFLYCFFSFVIVLLFGGPGTRVLEVEIYQAARSRMDFTLASRLALVETLIAMVVVVFHSLWEVKSNSVKGISFQIQSEKKKNISGFREKNLAFILGILLILFFFMPFISIVFSAFENQKDGFVSNSIITNKVGFQNFINIFSRKSFWLALGNSLVIGIGTSLMSVFAALFYSCLVKYISVSKGTLFLKILAMLPMAVSSVVMAFGIIQLVGRGNVFSLILAQSASCWPFSFRQIISGMDKIPKLQIQAARCLSPNPLDQFFMLYIPVCKKNILSALGFTFAISLGDTTLPLVLAIPRLETLALYTYKLAGSYRFNEACACGIILGLITIPVFVLTSKKEKVYDK